MFKERLEPPSDHELDEALSRHVSEAWFPRCLDEEFFGFRCDFDREWRPCGPHDKQLEFQARQTWVAAALLRRTPGSELLTHAARHGLAALRKLWDPEYGGWFNLTDRAGETRLAGCKHVHGMAYAISACAAVHSVLGDGEALSMARHGFEWIDRHAHDAANGGYFGFLRNDGTVIETAAQSPTRSHLDTVGTPLMHKDLNVQSDLLEAFTDLYRIWDHPSLETRLRELISVISDRMLLPSGGLAFLCRPDWTPVPHLLRYGYMFQTAARLRTAWRLLEPADVPFEVPERLIDFALGEARDRSGGGYFFAGPATGPKSLEGSDLMVRRKVWWVQFEALKALSASSGEGHAAARHAKHFAEHWSYLTDALLDAEFGGVRPVGRVDGREPAGGLGHKAGAWKDASHETGALLACRQDALFRCGRTG
jgi:cellobiose epimerase